jgi:hypothetical protein
MLCDPTSGACEKDHGFRIPAHIHLCVTADGSVLLDLKRDRYYGVGRAETLLLAAAVPEWPQPVWGDESSAVEPDHKLQESAFSLCQSLVSAGLLLRVFDASPRGDHRKADILDAHRGVAKRQDMKREWISIGDELEVESRIALHDVCDFVWAYMWVRASLAMRPFAATVESMRHLKDLRTADENAWPIQKVAAMVDAFRRLRPFFFAAEGRCLLHALTLVKFLSQYDFHPDWMIGVSTQPWGAHSWVQWGNFLLDTNPEKVCGYVPILTV